MHHKISNSAGKHQGEINTGGWKPGTCSGCVFTAAWWKSIWKRKQDEKRKRRRILYGERKFHILPSWLLLRYGISVHVAQSLKRIQGAWIHFEHTTLAFVQDNIFHSISDMTSYWWERTTLDWDTGVRNGISFSHKVSKNQVINQSKSLHFFTDSLTEQFQWFPA